jgi:hypothetical protein
VARNLSCNLVAPWRALLDRPRCWVLSCALLVARRTGRIVLLAGGINLIGVWLERLLLVFPPHTWRNTDLIVTVLVAVGVAGAFVLSTSP